MIELTELICYVKLVVIDTLGYSSRKRFPIWSSTERYKKMFTVPIDGVEDQSFEIAAKVIDKNGYKVPVFEVKVQKRNSPI